jgi:hypothetical protein
LIGEHTQEPEGKSRLGSEIDEALPNAAWGTTPLQNQKLMSHQDELGNNGTESSGLTKSDDGDDCVQKWSENVVHAPDGIERKKLMNSGRLRNSPPTGLWVLFCLLLW